MELVSNRDFILASILGHCIEYKKNVPTETPQALVSEAMEKGCVPAEGQSLPEPDPSAPVVPTDQKVRDEAIAKALTAIVARAEVSDFSSGGAPTMEAIQKVTGFAVDPKERSRVWGVLKPKLVFGKD